LHMQLPEPSVQAEQVLIHHKIDAANAQPNGVGIELQNEEL